MSWPSVGGGVRMSAGVAASVNGRPTWRITPQAGCSSSTVIPSAAASGEAKAADDVVDRPGRDLGRVEGAQPVGRRSAGEPRGEDRAQLGSVLDPVAVRREPRVRRRASGRPSAAQSRGHWRSRPGRDRDRAVGRRERLVRHDVRVGVAEPARRDAADEGVLGLVDEDGEGRRRAARRRPAGRAGGRARPARSRPTSAARIADRPEHPRHDVADRDADLGRLATGGVRRAGDRHQPARRLDHEVVAGPVRGRAPSCRSRRSRGGRGAG